MAVSRHPDMWFEDGNIVLVAGNTAFRVHKSILSRKATVFSDMFAASSPNAGETIEGIPAVQLSDDSRDVGYLVDAMYNGMKYASHEAIKNMSWSIVHALLYLGNKYGYEEFRKFGLAVLQREFPAKITDWDDSSAKQGKPAHAKALRVRKEKTGCNLIQAVNLARALRLSEIHAAALYECCKLPPEVLLQGASRDGVHAKLGPSDLIAVLNARNQLPQKSYEIFSGIFPEGMASECSTARRNMKARLEGGGAPAAPNPVRVIGWPTNACRPANAASQWNSTPPNVKTLFDPLSLEPYCSELDAILTSCVCRTCKSKYTQRFHQLRQAVLGDLVKIMGVTDL